MFFFKHSQKHRGRCFFLKTSPKNDIVKNWKTSHREKHRIVKKSEHRPPLPRTAINPPKEVGVCQSKSQKLKCHLKIKSKAKSK